MNSSSRLAPQDRVEPVRVLLVDDSPEDRAVVRWHLEADPVHRYDVCEARNGAEGLRHIAEHPPDCLVLDFHLPDMDGFRFLNRLAPDFQHLPLPVVVLTAFGDESRAEECLRRGVQDFLVKNFDMAAHLSRAVRGAIQRFRLAHERDLAEHALEQSALHFREITEAMPQLVWTTHPDGTPDYYNRRWIEFTGVTVETFNAEAWTLIHPDDRDRTGAVWRRSLETGEPYEIEYRLRHAATGIWRWMLARALPLRSAAGEIVGWFGTCTDIEERKRSETALQRHNEDLQQFAWAASHDLQEPLRMVNIYAQYLAKQYADRLDPDGLSFVQTVVNNAYRAEQLLRDLRDYWNASEVGFATPVSTPLTPALTEALGHLQTLVDETGAQVTHGPLPSVAGHPAALIRLFGILLHNAILFRDPERPPRISVTAARRGSDWLIRVEDNGIGISPEHHERIFGIFKRLHRHEKVPGTGMGLALARKLVERHGGCIWVESAPGQGSAFCFTLPAQIDRPPAAQPT